MCVQFDSRRRARLIAFATLVAVTCFAGCNGSGGGSDGGLGGLLGGILNQPPSAVVTATPAGPVSATNTVLLDASASSDPEGEALTFAWKQTAGPEVALSSATESQTQFYPPLLDADGELRFVVTVTDAKGAAATAEAVVPVTASGAFGGNGQVLKTYRDKLTPDEAYQLLRRAAFGARPEDVSLAVQRGLAATVDDLMTFKPTPAAITALADQYENDIPKRWMVHLLEGPNPLHERLAMFWHDRFATSRRVLADQDSNLASAHWQMLRDNALGNYRAFLEALTLDPLMLIWLDGANSPKSKPNENYAREFWELFTLGRDVLYTEDDIRESARAFTGITLLRQRNQDARPIFDIRNHDEAQKVIFPDRATPANFDYKGVIQLTLAQAEAARYVCRNLFVLFVHDHPSDATVQELANLFTASGFEIAPVVRQILTSQAMFSVDAQGNQVSSPVEHIVGVARTLDMHMQSEDSQGFVLDRLTEDLANAGQELLNPPGVDGWHEDLAWMQDQWVLSRVKALGRTMEYGPNRSPRLPEHLLPAYDTWKQRESRRAIVAAIAAVFHLPLTDDERDVYVDVLDQDGNRAFHLLSKDQQITQVIEMIRLMAMDERVIGR